MNVSYGQNSGNILECQPTGRERTTQLRPEQFGPAQINGKSSGCDHLAAGTVGLPDNTAQLAARRNQVVNANHLLNFYYDPISRPQSRHPPPRRQQRIKPYNKDLFLQANYKFVVLDTGCYDVESVEPDKMLPWEDVICVRFSTPVPVQCPICLERPLCPQITSCGHIYCFPCILCYLLLGEEDQKALEQLEDRMKKWMEYQTYSGSPPLRNSASPADSLKFRHNKTESQALNSIAYSDIAKSGVLDSAGRSASLEHEITQSSGKLGADSSPDPLAAGPEAFENSEKLMLSCTEEKALHHNSSSCKDTKEKDSYAFYQAIDGQHLILHPLNVKCLLHHYGNYDMLLPRISGKILELETVTQTEGTRSSLAPFMDEIKKREKQRKRRARKERVERARAEAAALHASLIPASLIPLEQRQYSPKDVTFSLDDFEALGSCSVPSTSPPVTGERKLFSDVTRLGFAAAYDSPSLGTEEWTDSSGNMERIGEASSIQGPWAPAATLSFANIISSARTVKSPRLGR